MNGLGDLFESLRRAKGDEVAHTEPAPGGDRGLPRVRRPQSVTSRLTQVFALGLVGLMGAGVLTWYYASAAPKPELERVRAEKAARDKAAGDQALPKLPPLEMPKYLVPPSITAAVDEPEAEAEYDESDELYVSTAPAPREPTLIYSSQASPPESATGLPPAEDPQAKAFARQLNGRVFARSALGDQAGGFAEVGEPAGGFDVPAREGDALAAVANIRSAESATSRNASAGSAAEVAKAHSRGSLRTQLPKGAVIDCTLLTAIDSQLPGLTTCITATDVFGADGKVVLLERGTQLVGEASADVQAGQTRVRVIWHEARTPAGIGVNLDSPGTDALGRSGVPGVIDRRFAERFGAAILMSVIDGAIAVAVESQRQAGSSSVVVSSGTSRDIATEVLKETVGIPPRIRVAQGARVAVLVAKDVDFGDVYSLVRSSGTR